MTRTLPIEQFTDQFAINAGRNPFNPSNIFCTYPKTWLDKYLRNEWHKIDPVAEAAKVSLKTRRAVPIVGDVTNSALYEEAKEFNAAANLALTTYYGGNLLILGAVVDDPTDKNLQSAILQSSQLTQRILTIERIDSLTDRQLDVLELGDMGLDAANIAAELGIGAAMVAKHKRQICQALEVASWATAVNAYSLEKWGGLVSN